MTMYRMSVHSSCALVYHQEPVLFKNMHANNYTLHYHMPTCVTLQLKKFTSNLCMLTLGKSTTLRNIFSILGADHVHIIGPDTHPAVLVSWVAGTTIPLGIDTKKAESIAVQFFNVFFFPHNTCKGGELKPCTSVIVISNSTFFRGVARIYRKGRLSRIRQCAQSARKKFRVTTPLFYHVTMVANDRSFASLNYDNVY